MSGYAICHGRCVLCQRLFSFNPNRVPSIRVNGEQEPVCGPCIEGVNVIRRGKGIAEFVIPEDAYSACEAEEVL